MKESPNSLLSKKEILLPVLAVCLVLILTFVFLIPKISQLFEVREKVAAEEGKISNLTKKLADLRTLSESDLFTSANFLLEALPVEKDFYRTLDHVKKLCLKNNVEIKAFSFTGSVNSSVDNAKEGLDSLSLRVAFSSPLINLQSLVADIESSLPVMQAESVDFGDFSHATGSAELKNLNGEIVIKGFSAPLPKTLAAVDKPLPKITSENSKIIEKLRSFTSYQSESQGVTSESPVAVGKENPFAF